MQTPSTIEPPLTNSTWRRPVLVWAAVTAAAGLLAGLLTLTGVLAPGGLSSSGGAIRLDRVFDDSPGGFTLRYPEGWAYTIPIQGLFLIAPHATLYRGEPGPTLTVQRSAPLSIRSLQEALDRYLSLGPMSSGTWRVTEAAAPVTFNGREALATSLEGADEGSLLEQRAHVLVTAANNTFVYVVVIAAPAAAWETVHPTLEAMLATLRILE